MNVRLPPALRPLWPAVKRLYTLATRLVSPITALLSRFGGGYLPRHAVETVDEVVEGEAQVTLERPQETVVREIPIGSPPDLAIFREQASEVLPRVAVAELPDGRVLGPSRAVITNAGTLIQELSPYFGTTRASEHPLHLHPFPGPPAELEGRIGVLAGRGDWSYYHFLIDILPRLEILERSTASAAVDRWYVPTSRRFQRELLTLMGLPSERALNSDELPHMRAERLIVPTFPDVHLKTPPWVVAHLRDRLIPDGLERVPGRRIYITRGREPNTRRVRNETEVLEALDGAGFSVVDPGSLSVSEQIRTFAEADLIVSPHGAALANLTFASAGASVVELFAPGFIQGCYWKLAACVEGLEYRYVVGEGKIPRNRTLHKVASDITIDVGALRGVLDGLPTAAANRH